MISVRLAFCQYFAKKIHVSTARHFAMHVSTTRVSLHSHTVFKINCRHLEPRIESLTVLKDAIYVCAANLRGIWTIGTKTAARHIVLYLLNNRLASSRHALPSESRFDLACSFFLSVLASVFLRQPSPH